MKKTLFLSAILGAALCSSAFADTPLVDYTTTVGGTTYAGAVLEYQGNASSGISSVTYHINKSGEVYDCAGNNTNPNLGADDNRLWTYTTIAFGNGNHGHTLALTGANGDTVTMHSDWSNQKFTLGGVITALAEGATEGAYVVNGSCGDFILVGNTTAGVNMNIGADTTLKTTYSNTVETQSSGTWNIASGKTLTLSGGRAFLTGGATVTVTGGGTLAMNITNLQKLQMDAGTKFVVSGTGTAMDLSSGLNTLQMGNNAQFTVKDGATLKIGANITTLTKGTENTIDVTNGGTLELAQTGDKWGFITSSDSNGTLKLTASEVQYHSQTYWDSFTGHVVISGGTLQVGNTTTKFQNAASLTITDEGIIKGHGGNAFSRSLILNDGGLGDALANETFSGSITLLGTKSYALVNSGMTVTLNGAISGGGSFTKKGAGSVTFSGNNAQVIKNLTVAEGTANVENANLTLTGFINAEGTLNVKSNLSTPDYMGMGDNASVVVSNGAKLTVADASTGKGIWINAGASLTLQGTSSLSIADDTITITGAGAKVTRHDNNATAKLGLLDNNNQKFTKNVKVTNGNVVYSGSGTLYLGSMQGGSLTSTGNIEFAGADSTIGSLTLSGNTITLGTAAAHDNDLTITSTLAVTANSTMNANLIVSNGATMDFSKHTELTMGCTVTIGNNVTIKIDDSELASIVNTGSVMTIINNVEGVDMDNLQLTLGSGWKFVDAQGNSLDAYNLRLDVVDAGDGKVNIVVAPEPATATLSLLALAGLCARRRRH